VLYEEWRARVLLVPPQVAKKESLTLPPVLAMRMAKASGRNLRRALLMLEATKVAQYPFAEDQALQVPDWELYIGALAKELAQEQSPQKLLRAREMLYELLTNCIPADVILKVRLANCARIRYRTHTLSHAHATARTRYRTHTLSYSYAIARIRYRTHAQAISRTVQHPIHFDCQSPFPRHVAFPGAPEGAVQVAG